MEERFVINDSDFAINFDTNKNNILKEDVIGSFELACKRKDCNKVEILENETKLKYKLSFKDNSSFSVIMNKVYYKENEQYIERLEDSVQAKQVILNNKIKKNMELLRKIAVASAGIAIVGTLAFNVVPKFVDHAIKMDNQKFEQEYIESGAQEMHDRLEEQKNHEAALEQFYNDSYEEGQIKTR